MEENTTPATDMPLIRVSASRRLMGVPWMITVHTATAAAGFMTQGSALLLIPLFVALGAGDPSGATQRLHTSIESGVISMDAYRFD
jgi:hypothetical protein